MHDLLDGEQVDVAEGLPLLAQSSFVTAHAAIAFFDAKRLLDELCVVAAMDIEGYERIHRHITLCVPRSDHTKDIEQP